MIIRLPLLLCCLCTAFTATATDTIPPPPAAVCTQLMDRVRFDWTPVAGADTYEARVFGAGSITVTGESFSVSGIPGDEVTVRLRSLGSCGPGEFATFNCQVPCPGTTILAITEDQIVCRDGNGTPPVALTSTPPGVWSGPGVAQDGSGGWQFSSLGLPAGETFAILAINDGSCVTRDSVRFAVRDARTVNITPLPTTICRNVPYDFSVLTDAPATAPVTAELLTPGTLTELRLRDYRVVFGNAGNASIDYAVIDTCGRKRNQEFLVNPSLGELTANCENATAGSLDVSWNVPDGLTAGVSTYEVSILGEDAVTTTETNFTFNGLTRDTDYELVVLASDSRRPCGAPARDTIGCKTVPCPSATSSLTADRTEFCAGDTNRVLLNFTTSIPLSGTVDWPAVPGLEEDNAGNFFFNPTGLEPGTYRVLANLSLDAGNCFFPAILTFAVNAADVTTVPPLDTVFSCVGESGALDLNDFLPPIAAGGNWFLAGDRVSNLLDPSVLLPGNYAFEYLVAQGVCANVRGRVNLVVSQGTAAGLPARATLSCNQPALTLTPTAGLRYAWSSEDPSFVFTAPDARVQTIDRPGNYRLVTTNAAGCSAVATVVIDGEVTTPTLVLETTDVTCFGKDDGLIEVTSVGGGRPPYTFSLDGVDRGSTTFLAGLGPAEYAVMVTDASGCSASRRVRIDEPEALRVRLEFPDGAADFFAGERVDVRALVNGGNLLDTILWTPDSLLLGPNLLRLFATDTRDVSVTVRDVNGCEASDRRTVIVRRRAAVFLPTAFSPNGDNTNDRFLPLVDPVRVTRIENFAVFDRWGDRVFGVADFPPNDPSFGWNGELLGEPLPPQVLAYTVTVRYANGESETFTGGITLIR